MKFWIIFAVMVAVVLVVLVFACFKVASESDIETEKDLRDINKDVEDDRH